jgi:hypothetical protein
MQFKDILEGQMFCTHADGYKYIKVEKDYPHTGKYGGIWFQQFKNRASRKRNIIYNFTPVCPVYPVELVVHKPESHVAGLGTFTSGLGTFTSGL